MKRCWLITPFAFLLLTLAACQGGARQVTIEVDNSQRQVTTEGATVREALAAAGIELGPLDRVRPDVYMETTPGMLIVVTRVEERFETERVTVPFARKTVVNEALPAGETRLVQLGANGEDEITYRVVLENGVTVERTEVSRVPVRAPVDEIMAVGAQTNLQSVPIAGTVAYLASGNAWVMRDNSSARRPLTTEGDLDGRVFDLSPDGRQLLFTRRLEGDVETPINQLWLVNTAIVGEKPMSLPVRGVLYGQWSPDGSRVAFSTAERTTSPPGWRANNDLWIGEPDSMIITQATQVISANTAGTYAWWGTTFSWSPDGVMFAYAHADQVGVVDALSGTVTTLADFAAYNTYSEWVWTPGLSWSPDGKFLAAVLHEVGDDSAEAPNSPAFGLWMLAADGSFKVRLAADVGMWSAPAWGAAGLLYGQAVDPLTSLDSRYALILRDHDGSNPQRFFPVAGEPGVVAPPEVAWSPDGTTFIFVYNGNLYLNDPGGGAPRQLTANGQNSRPRWKARPGT
jgi:Tol biopolymer transport system component